MSKQSIKVALYVKRLDEMIASGETMLAKHKELGAASPLNPLDMASYEKNLLDGKADRQEAKRLHDEAEKLNQQASLKLGMDKSQNITSPGTVYSIRARARDILLGINKGQEKKLSEWGFGVVIRDVVKGNKNNNPPK